jgi:hypothetical protein
MNSFYHSLLIASLCSILRAKINAATYKLNTYSSELNASRDRARAALLEIGTPAIKPMIALLQAEAQ